MGSELPARSDEGPPRIEAIDRALQVLSALAERGAGGAALTDIAEITGISKPTAYRALATMRRRGFVSQGKDGEYRLGPSALKLSERYFSKDNLQHGMHRALLELSRLTEELVHLGTWDGDNVVYVDKVEPSVRAIRVWSSIGQRVPAACSALGRALIGASSPTDAQLQHYLDVLPPERTVSRERLRGAIEEMRRTGFSSETEENEPGVACLGVPLMHNDRVVAAISITSLASRMTKSRRKRLQELVRAELPSLLPDGLTLYEPGEG